MTIGSGAEGGGATPTGVAWTVVSGERVGGSTLWPHSPQKCASSSICPPHAVQNLTPEVLLLPAPSSGWTFMRFISMCSVCRLRREVFETAAAKSLILQGNWPHMAVPTELLSTSFATELISPHA